MARIPIPVRHSAFDKDTAYDMLHICKTGPDFPLHYFVRQGLTMRRTTNDYGWLNAADGSLMGLSLGFDFCAEHEFGAKQIKEYLGIAQQSNPIGVEERTMTQVPEALSFLKFRTTFKDSNTHKTMPGALLYCCETYGDVPKTGAARAKHLGLVFYTNPGSRHYSADRDDLAIAWSSHGGFAILVRGKENVARLELLHKAFLRNDIALADPVILGFARKSLSLVIGSAVPAEMRQSVLDADLAHQRLLKAVAASGIESLLKKNNLGWFSLLPKWSDGEGSPLMFYLNPKEQSKYSSGWFFLDELQAWAQGKGPVTDHDAILAQLEKESPDWAYYLSRGMTVMGYQRAGGIQLQWLDAERRQIGARLVMQGPGESEKSRVLLPLEELNRWVQAGRSTPTGSPNDRQFHSRWKQ